MQWRNANEEIAELQASLVRQAPAMDSCLLLMLMCDRSILRVRERPHIDPERQNETIVEVLRDGVVVATIYGTREGVQVVSDRFTGQQPFPIFMGLENGNTSWTLSLLSENEPCPWCNNETPTCALCGASRRHNTLTDTHQ